MDNVFRTEIEHSGIKIEVAFDGFCLTVKAPDKYIFAASINDPQVSDLGNACLLLFSAEEVAVRMFALDPEKEIENASVVQPMRE